MTLDQNNVDGLERAPWYVAFFVRVGLPTAFAAVLLWFLMTNVTRTLEQVKDQIERFTAQQADTTAQIVANQAKIVDLLIQHGSATSTSTYLLQAMCYNQAKTAPEQARCADAFKPGLR